MIFLNNVTSIPVKSKDVQRCIHTLLADIQMTCEVHPYSSFAQWASYLIAQAPELDMLDSKEPTWHSKKKYKSALICSDALESEIADCLVMLNNTCVRLLRSHARTRPNVNA